MTLAGSPGDLSAEAQQGSISLIPKLLRHRSIRFRLAAISALLLGALVITSAILIQALYWNSRSVAAATEYFERLEAASGANEAFGDIRYWMTDLAVSQLTLSERNANEARAKLTQYLDDLAAYNSNAASDIAKETDAYMAMAFNAVEAYTDDNRVIGNTLLAQAREHSNFVDERLAQLTADLHRNSSRAREAAVAGASATIRISVVIVIGVGLLGIAAHACRLSLYRHTATPDRQGHVGHDRWAYRRQISRRWAKTRSGGWRAHSRFFGPASPSAPDLKESQSVSGEMMETAIETISEGFAVFDPDERLVIANSRYNGMYAGIVERGQRFEEMVRILVDRGIADLDGLRPEEWIERRLDRHRRAEGFFEQRYADGRWMRISERRTPDGGTVGVFADITELKDRQTELEAAKELANSANKEKSQFVANMSHELRTPLNAIIGYSEMLIEEAEDLGQAGFVPDLQKIRVAGKHLLGLINDILDFAKIEAGKMDVLVEAFRVEELVAQVETTMAPLISKNENTLEIIVASDLGFMKSDETKIRQNSPQSAEQRLKIHEKGHHHPGSSSPSGARRRRHR